MLRELNPQEANRECQRLHRQLEELTAAHKAFAAEASAREGRLQAQGAEREATLQVSRPTQTPSHRNSRPPFSSPTCTRASPT